MGRERSDRVCIQGQTRWLLKIPGHLWLTHMEMPATLSRQPHCLQPLICRHRPRPGLPQVCELIFGVVALSCKNQKKIDCHPAAHFATFLRGPLVSVLGTECPRRPIMSNSAPGQRDCCCLSGPAHRPILAAGIHLRPPNARHTYATPPVGVLACQVLRKPLSG